MTEHRLSVEAEETAPLVKFLSCKHEDLSLVFILHVKKADVLVCACDPRAVTPGPVTQGWG